MNRACLLLYLKAFASVEDDIYWTDLPIFSEAD